MIKLKCKLYSCRNADLTLIPVVAMTNGFSFKIIFHYSNLGGGGAGEGYMYALPGMTLKNHVNETVSYSFILSNKSDSIKLVRKLLNVGSTCNQSVSQSKLQEVNPTVIQSVSQSFNHSFIQLKEGS